MTTHAAKPMPLNLPPSPTATRHLGHLGGALASSSGGTSGSSSRPSSVSRERERPMSIASRASGTSMQDQRHHHPPPTAVPLASSIPTSSPFAAPPPLARSQSYTAAQQHLRHARSGTAGSSSVPPSTAAASSASGSKSGSFIGTPRLLSRQASARGQPRPPTIIATGAAGSARSGSVKGKARDEYEVPISPTESEVIETPQVRVERDPETGRRMINQYLVLHEIGHGTHGRVRLGRDMSVDVPPDELEVDLATGSGPFYAIKIVERNPRKKRLNGLGRQRALGRSDGAKLVDQNEIKKEIAIFKKVHHPNVVRMKEIIDDPDSSKLFMVLEYCEGGEVQWKAENGPALTLAETRKIFRDTLLGLEYLHHQGIIHRDIKPSNLLRSGDIVKIADFGCSHYSEALLAASAAGGEEAYVDDIELAKTAGSPAFFAPEMCYSEIPDDLPQCSPILARPDLPSLAFHPPEKGSGDDTDTSATAKRPSASRSETQNTLRRQRHPITNAIDVWALGVTLYCLLFGKTPFDAPNEYLLMQVIPTAQYKIPPTMGRDALPTGEGASEEVREALDLLSKLLEKDANKRITLDGTKHHPFTLGGLNDPQGWLTRTDPHAQSFVTVTNDEVAAAVTRGRTFSDKVRRGIKNIGQRLGFGRHHKDRRHSVTDTDVYGDREHSGSSTDANSSSRRVASGNDAIGVTSSGITAQGLARRLSLLSRDRSYSRPESPRPLGLLASHMNRSPPSHASSGGQDDHHHQPHPPHHRLPRHSISSEAVTPKQLASISSLDKLRSNGDASPTADGSRHHHSLMEHAAETSRPRSSSNASSSASSLFGAIGRGIFMRDGHGVAKRTSQRGNGVRARGHTGSSEDADGGVFAASSIDSHHPADSSGAEFLRGRSFESIARGHSRQSLDSFASGSPSSPGHGSLTHMAMAAPSPERLGWGYAFRHHDASVPRRGSTLSEDIRPVLEDEEVDWDGAMPDSDDEEEGESNDIVDGLPQGHGITSAPADWNISEHLAELERQHHRSPPQTPRTHSQASILRPGAGIDLGRVHHPHTAHGTPTGSPRPPPSSFAYRAKSPLGNSLSSLGHAAALAASTDPTDPSSTSTSVTATPVAALQPATAPSVGSSLAGSLGSASLMSHASAGSGTSGTGSWGTGDRDRFADADEDDGLVLSMRSRRGSVLSRQGSLNRRGSAFGRSPSRHVGDRGAAAAAAAGSCAASVVSTAASTGTAGPGNDGSLDAKDLDAQDPAPPLQVSQLKEEAGVV